MRLWIFSDLHRDVGAPWRPPRIPEADVAIVAGDVGGGLAEAVEWRAAASPPHMPVVLVAGNHEFYRRTYAEELARGRTAATERGIHFLENDTVTFGDVAVSGCTLWTDYDLDGRELRAASMRDARSGLNDHRLIRWATRPRWLRFRPEEALALHLRSRAFLAGALARLPAAPDNPHVVVTHHAPSALSVAERFRAGPLNPAYASRLDALVEEACPTLWVHGHVHDRFDYRIGATRVLCNPHGYPTEATGFDPGLVIEL